MAAGIAGGLVPTVVACRGSHSLAGPSEIGCKRVVRLWGYIALSGAEIAVPSSRQAVLRRSQW